MEEIKKIIAEIDGQKVEKTLFRRQNGFDTETGQPVMEEVIHKGFDPYTGEPVYKAAVQAGFDTETGAALYRLAEDMAGADTAGADTAGADTAGADTADGSDISEDPGRKEAALSEMGEEAGQMPFQQGIDQAGGQPPFQQGMDQAGGQSPLQQGMDQAGGQPPLQQGMDQAGGQPPFQQGPGMQQGQMPPQMRPGMPGRPPKKKSKLPVILAIAGGVLLLLLIACIGVVALTSSNGTAKVMKAAKATFEEDTLGAAVISAYDIMSSDEVTVNADISFDTYYTDVMMSALMACDTSDAKFYSEADISIPGSIDENISLYFDDSILQAGLPKYSPTVYEFDYKCANTGYLADIISSETSGTIEDVGDILTSFSLMMKENESYKKMLKNNLTRAVSDIEVTKTSPRTVNINGRDVKCRGYRICFTDKDLKAIGDAVISAERTAYADAIETFDSAAADLGIYASMSEAIDQMEEDMASLEEFRGYADVFISDGKIAAIVSYDENEQERFSIEFRGGDTATSNIVITDEYGSVIEKKSYLKGTEENGSIYADGEIVFSYSYDPATGSFSCTNGYGDQYSGTFLVTGDSIKTGFVYDSYGTGMDLSLDISKGASIQSIKGTTFDIGNASEADFEREYQNLMPLMEKIAGAAYGM